MPQSLGSRRKRLKRFRPGFRDKHDRAGVCPISGLSGSLECARPFGFVPVQAGLHLWSRSVRLPELLVLSDIEPWA